MQVPVMHEGYYAFDSSFLNIFRPFENKSRCCGSKIVSTSAVKGMVAKWSMGASQHSRDHPVKQLRVVPGFQSSPECAHGALDLPGLSLDCFLQWSLLSRADPSLHDRG